VDAFFRLLGEEWRPLFNIVLTREFRHVKPDYRLMHHLAEQWGLAPEDILMVGDSLEDVEVRVHFWVSTYPFVMY
jgi:HAD superfamily hydrolase (TIGR01549 family)